MKKSLKPKKNKLVILIILTFIVVLAIVLKFVTYTLHCPVRYNFLDSLNRSITSSEEAEFLLNKYIESNASNPMVVALVQRSGGIGQAVSRGASKEDYESSWAFSKGLILLDSNGKIYGRMFCY